MSKVITVDCRDITDWASFHEEFARLFKFPAFYGRNSAAWVDCMTNLTEMAGIDLEDDDVVTIQLIDGQGLKHREPHLLTELFEMVAFVNYRRLEANEPGRLCVSAFIE